MTPWLQFSLEVFHGEVPGGGPCECGLSEDDVLRTTKAPGLAGLNWALGEAETAVDSDLDCAGRYEAAGPGGYTRSYP